MKNPLKKLKPPFAERDRELPFLEHLDEFRTMLIRSLLAVACCTVLCIPLAKPLLNWLKEPLLRVASQNNYSFELITTSPVEGFMQVVKIIFAAGVLLSLPFIIYFVARFVFPGLKENEQKMLVYGGLAGAVLFAAGVTLCYTITLPVAIKVMFYFNSYLGAAANWKIDTYLSFVLQLLISFGLIFELPLILLLLGHLGIITTAQMRRYRRHVIIGLLVLAMLLTPGPDVISQLQMAIPLYILYELCILILLFRDWKSGAKKGGSGK
jgi:sec-independent protein translocase protein TatC